MIPITYYLLLNACIVVISFIGMVINRNNLIGLLLCIELLLLAISGNFIACNAFLADFKYLFGQAFVFFILTVAAAESAIGLAILVLWYRLKHSVNLDEMQQLRG